jgi:glycosyltransferase involved in cell wall biosynthesis
VSADFPELRLTLFTNRSGSDAVRAERLTVRNFGLPRGRFAGGPPRIALEQVLAAASRADLLHFFDLTAPLLAPWKPFVATVHDLSLGSGLHRRRHTYKRALWPWAARRARGLVAVSEFTAREAAARLGVSSAKIDVIRSGPGLSAHRTDGNSSTPRAPYFVYVGDLTARKNVPFLVRAFDRADVDAELLLVGNARDDASGEVRAAIAEARHGGRIRIVDSASDSEVDALYRSALALAMPSRYEGFGFTPLEAMARGCPVVESDIPALREISGSGALLVPLDDEAGWADSLRRLAADETIRAELRERGAETVRQYSWEQSARELCELFLRLGGGTE